MPVLPVTTPLSLVGPTNSPPSPAPRNLPSKHNFSTFFLFLSYKTKKKPKLRAALPYNPGKFLIETFAPKYFEKKFLAFNPKKYEKPPCSCSAGKREATNISEKYRTHCHKQ
jgi:hypothetical protein